MSPALRAALGIVRAWTRLYTACIEPGLRDARRAEIESDLWECHEDARRRGATPMLIAVHMLLRLLLGIRDDLMWRAEHRRVDGRLVRHALWAAAVASVVLLWSMMAALQTKEPALSPVAGPNLVRMFYPVHLYSMPPPAPPPPPEFARLGARIVPPPPPPPPPKPAWR